MIKHRLMRLSSDKQCAFTDADVRSHTSLVPPQPSHWLQEGKLGIGLLYVYKVHTTVITSGDQGNV